MSKKDRKSDGKEVRNKKVHRDYFVEETHEAGIILAGTEVKSIRAGKAQISDSFARIRQGAIYLENAHIDEYSHGNINNHEPKRPRKLLLHRREILRLRSALEAGGKTLVPLRLYFKGGLIKVELGICTGKKTYDKRDDVKKKDQEREIERALKPYRR